MSVWTQPSPSDVDRAADRIAAGEPISEACKAEGFTLTRLRQCDRAAWAGLKQLWHDVQGTEDRHLARETFRQIAADEKLEPQHRTAAAVQLAKSSGYVTERSDVVVSGGMEVDISAGAERFLALADAAVRALTRPAENGASGRVDAGGAGVPRLPVAELDRPAEPT